MSLASSAFTRAGHRLFAHFGEAAVLRDGEPVLAVLADGVHIVGEYGQVSQLVTTVTLMAATGAKVGDPITLGTTAWVLDALLRGDGHTLEFVVRKASS